MIRQRQALSGHLRALRRMAGISLCAAAAAAGVAAAEFDPKSSDLGRFRRDPAGFAADLRRTFPAEAAPALDRSARFLPRERGFYQGYLLPRLTTQFDRLSLYQALPIAGAARDEFVMFDDVTGAAKRRAERGVSRAVSHYLLDATSISRWIDSFGTESTRTLEGPARTGSFRTDFGFAQGLPRFGVRYRTGNTLLRLSLAADRNVGFELRRGGAGGTGTATAFSAKYDRDERAYTMGCRIGF